MASTQTCPLILSLCSMSQPKNSWDRNYFFSFLKCETSTPAVSHLCSGGQTFDLHKCKWTQEKVLQETLPLASLLCTFDLCFTNGLWQCDSLPPPRRAPRCWIGPATAGAAAVIHHFSRCVNWGERKYGGEMLTRGRSFLGCVCLLSCCRHVSGCFSPGRSTGPRY